MRTCNFSKKLFVLFCLLVIVSPIFAIEFGVYGYNEYALGNFADYSKTSVGGGLNLDYQFSSKFPLGIGLRVYFFPLAKLPCLAVEVFHSGLTSLLRRFSSAFLVSLLAKVIEDIRHPINNMS